MTNLYYTFSRPASPFTTLDPRPYNREFTRIVEGFSKITPPQQLTTGTQYFGHAQPIINPVTGLPYPSSFSLAFSAFPANFLTGSLPPDGVRLFFTFPFDVMPDPLSPDTLITVISTVDPSVIFAAIQMLDANGQPYPDGTFLSGVIYEVVINGVTVDGNSRGQVLSGGAAILGAVQRQTAAAASSAAAALASQVAASNSLGSATASYNSIVGLYNSALNRIADYNGYTSSPTFRGLVKIEQGDPPVSRPAPYVFSRNQGFNIYNASLGKADANHTHLASAIVPSGATLSSAGFVQLDATTSSASTSMAATASVMGVLSTTFGGKANLIHTHDASAIVPSGATLTSAGFVQLFDGTGSTSTTLAATPNSVKQVNDALSGKANLVHTHPFTDIVSGVPTASTTVQGLTQLVSNSSSTSLVLALSASVGTSTRTAINGKANLTHTHPFSDITDPPAASTTQQGIVKLSPGGSTSTAEAISANSMRAIANTGAQKLSYVAPSATYPVGSVVMGAYQLSSFLSPVPVSSGQLVSLGANNSILPSNCAGETGTDPAITFGTWRNTSAVTSRTVSNPSTFTAAVSIWVRVV